MQISSPKRRSHPEDDTPVSIGKESNLKHPTKFKQKLSVLGFVLALSIAVALIVGCSTNATKYEGQLPVDDKLSFLEESTNGNGASASISLFDVLNTLVDKVIGVVGGVINLEVDGTKIKFEVPAGALTHPTRITMDVQRIGTPVGKLFVYDCGPDGTKFNVDAKLSQQMPAGQKRAFLYYFNESRSKWELQEVVDVSNGYATFRIKHFSKYGIS